MLLGGLKKGLIFVLSAPAGTGKTTLVRLLTKEFACVVESVSFTTRKPRSNEIEGKDYHFITDEEFLKKVEKGDFLEYAKVFGYHYGTSKTVVDELLNQGKHVVLIIDTQGAMQLKKLINAVYIFVSPPNFDELKKRLHGRQSESVEEAKTRLEWAHNELALAKEYDYKIVNENLDTAYQILRAILIAEEHKSKYIN